ncbi:hypothetical protein GGR53DRAFT_493627, partial [Hypoxylon sp. FL1150]
MAPVGQRPLNANANANPLSDTQIAASNSTLNTWVGRRQPSWLANSKPVKPSPRPRPSRQSSMPSQSSQITEITEATQISQTQTTRTTQTTQITQTTPAVATAQPASVPVSAPAATPAPPRRSQALPPQRQPVQVQTTPTSTAHPVLPSPAPSDEPSPGSTERLSIPFTTEARFVLDTNLDDQPEPSTVLPRTSSVSASPRTSTPTMVVNTPPTPNIPSLNPNIAAHREHLEQPPAKRRCVGTAQLQFLQSLGAARNLRANVQRVGGEQNLEESVERPRYNLLAEACDVGDLFFVALHQLFCAWTANPVDIHQLCNAGVQPVLDNAFGIMGTHLKTNSKIRPQHLQWFATFPAPLKNLQVNPIYGAVVKEVFDFLMRVSSSWQIIHQNHMNGRFPLLMGELLNNLALFSPILQTIMFRASRRSLGIPDGPHAMEMEKLFRADQRKHMHIDGTFIRQPGSKEYHAYNNSLIESYRRISLQGFTSNTTHQTGQQSVPAGPPVTQQPGVYPLHMNPQIIPQSQFNPDTATGFQYGPVPSPSISPVDEASRMLFPHSQPLVGTVGTPLNVPSPIPTANSPFQGAPVPSQLTLPSQNAPNAFTPQVSGQFLRQQQIPERRFSQQNAFTAPASPHLALNPTAPHPGFINQPGQQQPQGVPNFNNQPQISRGVSYPEAQVPNTGGFIPIASAPSIPHTQQPMYYMNTFQVQNYPSPQLRQKSLPSNERLVPPPGERIGLGDYPHDPQDTRSITSSLHQAHLRSPKRRPRELRQPMERHYQAVKGFLTPPVAIPPQPYLYKFKFTISEMDCSKITKDEKITGELLPVNLYSSGSLRVRVRCCYKEKSAPLFTQNAWSMADARWPEHIFMELNGSTLGIRRKAHFSRDMPAEASSVVVSGENLLTISIPPGISASSSQEPYIAVELVETLSHGDILQMVQTRGKEPADKTRETIKRRLAGSSEDDDLAMVNDLSIDLADPFSMNIFNTPVRGENCTHLECFDLETWLNTRLGKKCCYCNNTAGCRGCAREPSFVDKWKCPLCGCDARPYSLRIDEYLVEVRSQLENENKLRTKSILVSPDGTWRPKEEHIDDSDIDSEDDGSGPPMKKSSRSTTAVPQGVKPQIEVIELD